MAGAIAYISRDTDGVAWRKVFTDALGPIDFRTIGEGLGNTDDIEIALAWKPKPGLLRTFRNLKMIVSLGMGVDHLLADDQLPEGVPITRIMDDGLVGQMSEYAIFWTLWHHRDIDEVRRQPAGAAMEARGVRRHPAPPHRRHGPGQHRPGHGDEARHAGLPDRWAGAAPPRRCPASRPSTAATRCRRSSAAAASW